MCLFTLLHRKFGTGLCSQLYHILFLQMKKLRLLEGKSSQANRKQTSQLTTSMCNSSYLIPEPKILLTSLRWRQTHQLAIPIERKLL